MGERPLALVLLRPEFAGKITENALRHYAAHVIETSGISRYACAPYCSWETLVKTSVGKMNKRRCVPTRMRCACNTPHCRAFALVRPQFQDILPTY